MTFQENSHEMQRLIFPRNKKKIIKNNISECRQLKLWSALVTSLYSHDIQVILALVYWIIKPDYKNKYLVTGDWRQSRQIWCTTFFFSAELWVIHVPIPCCCCCFFFCFFFFVVVFFFLFFFCFLLLLLLFIKSIFILTQYTYQSKCNNMLHVISLCVNFALFLIIISF